MSIPTDYPDWVLAIAVLIILVGVMPIPMVFLLRRSQCVKLDIDIHQGSIRRIETTVSTKEMMGDVDVSLFFLDSIKNCTFLLFLTVYT